MAKPVAANGPVREVVGRLEEMSDRAELRLGELLEAFGPTSFVPALMVPAILVVSPLSGIPLFSSICGLTIMLIALQMVFARRHLWLPRFVMERRVKGDKLRRAMVRMRRVADFMDRMSRDRLRFLVMTPCNRIPQAMCAVSGGSMPFLELLPFSSSILGMAVLSCAVGFLARDGLFVFIGAAFMSLAAAIPIYAWTALSS
ncbi:MAG: putative ABC transporter permease component [Rhodobacteraceae bacterium HLUCCA08]|nr:MAG: putative ABC transporter permease component [Rhodobacteraceae bacterium HLUCCA08]